VIRAITQNFSVMIATTLLGIWIMYTFSLLAFYFIDEVYYDFDIGDGERSCTSMIQCLIKTINYVYITFYLISIILQREFEMGVA